MNFKRMAAMLLAAAVMTTTLSACSDGGNSSSTGGEKDEILLGAIGPLTGAAADYGITATNGLKLAVAEVNANGGVLGKQVKLLDIMDDENDTTKAVNGYNKLTGQGMDVLWGPVTSKPAISVAQKAAKDNMPMVAPTATASAVTEAGGNVFRACFLDPTQGEAVAQYSKEKLGMNNVAVLYDITDDYSIGLAEAFKGKAEALGMTVTAYESFSAGDTDFKSQLVKIGATNPEGLFVPSYYNTNALIAIQAVGLGMTDVRFMGGDGWDGVLGVLEGSSASAADGAVFSSHFFAGSDDADVKSFVEAYKAEYGSEPTSFAALGYDAAKILFAAIEKAGSTDRAAVVAALGEVEYTGVTGSIHYEGSGDPVKDISMLTVEDGAYKLLEQFNMN